MVWKTWVETHIPQKREERQSESQKTQQVNLESLDLIKTLENRKPDPQPTAAIDLSKFINDKTSGPAMEAPKPIDPTIQSKLVSDLNRPDQTVQNTVTDKLKEIK